MPTRLADGVWALDLGLFPPIASNAYLADHGEPTLVDAGLPVNPSRLLSEIRALGYGAADVDRVLLTHYDLDHTGGVGALREAGFDGSVHVGRGDVKLMNGARPPSLVHPKGLFHLALRPFFRIPGVEPVSDGDRIGGFEAYHTPGHNPGHTAFVHEGLDAAFLGDLVWEEDRELTPPFWLDSYDMRALRSSIRSFARRTPAFEVACMGHGEPLVEGGHEALLRLVDRLR
jgi:glyoxylase-like metal-dependent hydrolase (beta-lactamase superfamily II)